ncbi:hypothetical protein ACFV2B_25860 [Streptomyces lavendulae]|uniref:hypothetical protein n=1 Tax=Streptomyces lavendulae TaxID=1914 RepID=UPI0036743B5C
MTDPTLPPPGTPVPGIDPVHRLRVMAAAVRGAHVAEHVVDAPFEEVWPLMAALGFLPDFHHVRVVRADADGGRFEALARGRYGFRAHLRGFARPGWCWLQSRFLIVGLAAAPAPDPAATRIALTGGVRVPTRAAVVPFATRRELDEAAHRLASSVRAARLGSGG